MYVFENEYGLGRYIPNKMIFFQKLSKTTFKSVQCLRCFKQSQHSYFEALEHIDKDKESSESLLSMINGIVNIICLSSKLDQSF